MTTKRVIGYLIIVIILSVGFNYSRIAVRFIKLPKEVEKYIKAPTKLIVIQGNPCTSCESGRILNSLDQENGNRI